MPEPPKVPGPAAIALFSFIDESGLTLREAAEALKTKHPSLIAWRRGITRPDPYRRKLIAVWTHGRVPEEMWLTDDERASLATAEPFQAAEDDPPSQNGHEPPNGAAA